MTQAEVDKLFRIGNGYIFNNTNNSEQLFKHLTKKLEGLKKSKEYCKEDAQKYDEVFQECLELIIKKNEQYFEEREKEVVSKMRSITNMKDRESWTYDDWEKKDDKGLINMYKNNRERYDLLLNKWKETKNK